MFVEGEGGGMLPIITRPRGQGTFSSQSVKSDTPWGKDCWSRAQGLSSSAAVECLTNAFGIVCVSNLPRFFTFH